MSFSATVRKTGDLFQATTLWEPEEKRGRDAHELVDGESYMGHLFTGTRQENVSNEQITLSYSGVTTATPGADELKLIPQGRIHIIPRGSPTP
jgi:hypothetical protein